MLPQQNVSFHKRWYKCRDKWNYLYKYIWNDNQRLYSIDYYKRKKIYKIIHKLNLRFVLVIKKIYIYIIITNGGFKMDSKFCKALENIIQEQTSFDIK